MKSPGDSNLRPKGISQDLPAGGILKVMSIVFLKMV